MRVLIVDDAGFVRELLRNVLMPMHLDSIVETGTPESVLQLIKQHKIDLVFLDLVLPNKNGITLAREIKASDSRVRIVAITSMDREDIREEAIKAGCELLIQKPFKKSEIESLIRSYYEKKAVVNG